jgi:hypothetical protein
LSGHTIHTAQSKGWDTLSNGALLDAAEDGGFELLLTTDRRIRYQQNLQARRIALVVLTGSTRWSRVRQQADRIVAAVAAATPGSYAEVEIPLRVKSGSELNAADEAPQLKQTRTSQRLDSCAVGAIRIAVPTLQIEVAPVP